MIQPSRQALEAFLANPDMPRPVIELQHCDLDLSFTAFDITKEALRLYPSAKSVYRSVPNSDTDLLEMQVADVETLHRLSEGVFLNPELRNSSGNVVPVEQFYPGRWLRSQSELAQEAYIPFGVRPLECPAKKEFGERMLAVLIGTLVMGLDGYEVYDTVVEENSLRDDKTLPAGRMDLGRWVVLLTNDQKD